MGFFSHLFATWDEVSMEIAFSAPSHEWTVQKTAQLKKCDLEGDQELWTPYLKKKKKMKWLFHAFGSLKHFLQRKLVPSPDLGVLMWLGCWLCAFPTFLLLWTFFSTLVSRSGVRVLVQSLKCCILASRLLLGVDGKSPVGFHFYFCQLLCSTPIKGQIILN